MRPSRWLQMLDPLRIYDHSEFQRLCISTGLQFDERTGYLAGGRVAGNVRHHLVPRMTPRQALAALHQLGWEAEMDGDTGDDLLFGWQITESVWWLLRPITEQESPAGRESDPESKQQRCLSALWRLGY